MADYDELEETLGERAEGCLYELVTVGGAIVVTLAVAVALATLYLKLAGAL